VPFQNRFTRWPLSGWRQGLRPRSPSRSRVGRGAQN